MKLDFDDKVLAAEIGRDLDTALAKAQSRTSHEAYRAGLAHTQRELGSSGFSLWSKGYKIEQLGEGEFLISISGKLAEGIDRGWNVGEISKMIMGGNRAKFNQGEGKNYVDVPIGKDSDVQGMFNIPEVGRVKIAHFKDANDMIAKFSKKTGGIVEARRKTERAKIEGLSKEATKRVENLIKTTDPIKKKSKYVMIKRVTDDSIWPKTYKKGPEALEVVGRYFENNFDRIFSEVL